MNGFQLAKCDDPVEMAVLQAAAQRTDEIRRAEREELAKMITQEIAKAWNSGQKGS